MNDQTHDFVLWALTSNVTMLPVAIDIELGSDPTSLIIRLSNELRDAQASLRRVAIVARAPAAMPSNKEYCDHGR